MLIKFWFGLIHIGRPSGIGCYRYGAAITLCLGNRGDVPPGELSWHRIWRLRWNWLPDAIYAPIGAVAQRQTTHELLTAAISGKPSSLRSEYELPIEFENAIDSSRWTGRDRRFVGFGAWQRDYWSHRSSWRTKMYVYLTGSKERGNPKHILYVAPGAVTPKAACPSEWLNADADKTPKQFAVEFIHGKASVDNQLGEWLLATGQAQKSRLIRNSGKMLLGSLASAIAGR